MFGLGWLLQRGAWSVDCRRLATYYFQANLLRSGHLWLEPPTLAELFRTDLPTAYAGVGSETYPPGAPAMFGSGAIVVLAWLVGPLCSLVGLACTAFAARQLFGDRVALLTLAFGLISPFVLLLAGSFMSEPTAVAWLAAACQWP